MSVQISKSNPNKYSKLTLEQLREEHDRVLGVLRNRTIVKSLPDKGQMLEKTRDILKAEIDSRQCVSNLAEDISNLNVEDSTGPLDEKHVKYVCSLEKTSDSHRFIPGSSLVRSKFEDKPAKTIPLRESLLLQSQLSISLPPSIIRRKIEGKLHEDESETHQEEYNE